MSPVNAYVETLKTELALVAILLPDGVEIEHLHWGGGTPTLLPAETMTALAQEIFDHIPMAEASQFSVEIDPNEIDDARMDALVAAGMNRASIGVQDFDHDVQKAVNRIQSYEETRDVIKSARENNFRTINIDLIYGLPLQTESSFSETLEKVIELSPERISVYNYAHLPHLFKTQKQIGDENRLSTETFPTVRSYAPGPL